MRLSRSSDLVYRVLTDQGEQVGSLKLINAIWKFKAIGYDAQGALVPGGGSCAPGRALQVGIHSAGRPASVRKMRDSAPLRTRVVACSMSGAR